MIASLPRVTEAVAKGIVAEYPTMRELYESWERCESEKERKEMLRSSPSSFGCLEC
jgi:hypothetical protein